MEIKMEQNLKEEPLAKKVGIKKEQDDDFIFVEEGLKELSQPQEQIDCKGSGQKLWNEVQNHINSCAMGQVKTNLGEDEKKLWRATQEESGHQMNFLQQLETYNYGQKILEASNKVSQIVDSSSEGGSSRCSLDGELSSTKDSSINLHHIEEGESIEPEGFCAPDYKLIAQVMASLKNYKFVPSRQKKFVCNDCSYECYHKGNFKTHLLTHTDVKLFKCPDCNYECNEKGNLKRHTLTHSGIKLFKCSQCLYECNRKADLKGHMAVHSGIKLFKCSECNYGCNRKGHLMRHMIIHSGIKLFKCSECNYGCNEKENLKRHRLVHSAVKLFKCNQCDYECNRKGHLMRHTLGHSGLKLFQCSECDFGCNRKITLHKHIKKHIKIHSEESDLNTEPSDLHSGPSDPSSTTASDPTNWSC